MRRTAEAVAIAAAVAAAYLLIAPPSADLPAHAYRVGLFEREGFTLFNGQWYGGHHTPGYSLLFPAFGALVGMRVAAALAVVASAAAFAALAHGHFGDRARWGVAWFAVGASSTLFGGRMTFALGIAIALAAALAAQRGRLVLAAALAALTAAGSPVAALFLALAGVAVALGGSRASGVALALPALAATVLLTIAFPEGGTQPFLAATALEGVAAGVLLVALLPPEQRVVRIGAVLWTLSVLASWLLDTPMGSNALRFGALFGGPVLACALLAAVPRRLPRALAAAAVVTFAYFQWVAPLHDVQRSSGDPSARPGYFDPLLGFLRTRPGAFRVEIPFTASHWEAARVAPSVALARGWERQLDTERNALFYGGTLTPATYRAWLDSNAVAYVALADAPLDPSGRAEARLVKRGLPYLRPAWRSAHWRVFAVASPAPLGRGAARVTALGSDEVRLAAARPGVVDLRVRWSPYWALAEGHGCVERGPGGFTRVRAAGAGGIRLVTRFSVGRIVSRGPRCS